MIENKANVFASEEYILLAWLSKNLTCSKKKATNRFSQIEIADELDCSPTTINKRMRMLQQAKCVELDGKKGYIITDKGKKIIKKMNEIEDIIGGKKNGNQ